MAPIAVVLCVAAVACTSSPPNIARPPGGDKGTIVVGVSGSFTENQLVAEMYAQVLEHAGYTVERQFDLRSREVSQSALESGQIDLKPEYECPQRPYCLTGLKSVYDILFWDFVPLDAGGPKTVEALKNNDVQIGLLFSTDPSIKANGFVPLIDDKHLQDAENITPVIRTAVLNDQIRNRLDAVSAVLTTENVTALIGKVVLDGQDIATVATSFLRANHLL
jgi:osmoprotectant transport system substrate-binding protein